MMGDFRVHLSTLSWVFSSFWPKPVWSPCPVLPIHLISPQKTSDSPRWSMSSKGSVLLMWKRWNKKWQEAQKGIKIDEFKNYFEQWKKCLKRYIASNGKYFKDNLSLKDFVYFQRGRRERERERNMDRVTLTCPQLEDLAYNPGMCPDWYRTSDLVTLRFAGLPSIPWTTPCRAASPARAEV